MECRRKARPAEDPGAALQPFRDTRPLPQVQRSFRMLRGPCGSGLVSRKGRKAAPKAYLRASPSARNICRMPRMAWRMRSWFSIRAKRT
ncbi:hypothetical protein GEV39_04035 [Pseudomonas sp. NY5710]|nr:hypothetical protein GEV39_04035 [Pseudomonas sp. NY5710]